MKYTIEKYPHCPPRHGFSIFSPDYRTRLRDIAPIGIVRELNKLLRRIEKLEKEAKSSNKH
jgi:hypothetical protein